MTDIILHHYPTSPFAEKVRVALGIKGLRWQSVVIPIIMPKPDLMPLTGGYRKTPVMQIGADIYCDTQLILRELEHRYPEPSLYRGTDAGTANAMAYWSDRSLFSTAVGVAFANRPDAMPPEFIADRSKFSGRELNPEKMRAALPMLLDQMRAQFDWYERMLSDGRPWLLGEHPTLVDCAAYHLCWFILRNAGTQPISLRDEIDVPDISVADATNVVASSRPHADPFSEFPYLQAWIARVKEIGHGQPAPMTARDALAVAKSAMPQTLRATDAHDPSGRKPGDRVQVVPDDSGRDPVMGELIASSRDEIVIRRVDDQVGEIAVHFPRAGFIVRSVSN